MDEDLNDYSKSYSIPVFEDFGHHGQLYQPYFVQDDYYPRESNTSVDHFVTQMSFPPESEINNFDSLTECSLENYMLQPGYATLPRDNIITTTTNRPSCPMETTTSSHEVENREVVNRETVCSEMDDPPAQRTYCDVKGCHASVARPTDLNRHKKQKHDIDAIRHVCGCCEGESKPREAKRKDKLKEHKVTKHGCSKSIKLMECPRKDVHGQLKLWFCSQANLDSHLRLVHGESHTDIQIETVSEGPNGHINALPCLASVGSQVPIWPDSSNQSDDLAQPSGAQMKRPISPKPEANIKRAKLGITNNTRTATDADLRVAFSRFEDSINLCDSNEARITLEVPNVRPTEFLRLSKLGVLPGFKYLNVSFDTSKSIIRIEGLEQRAQNLNTILQLILKTGASAKFIESVLPQSMKPKLPEPNTQESNLSSTEEHTKENSRPHIFSMNSKTDCSLVMKWHTDIVSFIMTLLDRYLGSCYSASLVRQGDSERRSKVVLRIQCRTVPSPKVRAKIQAQVREKFGMEPNDKTIGVTFSKGDLLHLAGLDGPDEQEEPMEPSVIFPNYQLYWHQPGMGASVGMLADDMTTATLGCWIHIDNELYLLTVRHLIMSKVFQEIAEGKSPGLQVTSPSLAGIRRLKENLDQFQRDNEYEIEDAMERIGGPGRFLKADDANNSEELTKLHEDQEMIKTHRQECDYDPTIGIFTLWSNSDVRKPITPHNNAFGHVMDWAACKATGRVGINKHRFRYDAEKQACDFWDHGDDGMGAGELVQEVASVAGDESVHFVGQASGRMNAKVSLTQMLLDRNGTKSLEWTLIPPPDQQKEENEYCGDSGASIIRNADNVMIGHLWGAADNQLLFTPMQDVFADIKAKAGTDNVGLANNPSTSPTPDVQVAVTEYTLTCRDDSKIRPKVRIQRADLSSIPRRPKNKPAAKISLPIIETTPGPMMKLQLASAKNVPNSVLSNINNQSGQIRGQIPESTPILLRPLSDLRLASPLQQYKLLLRMFSHEKLKSNNYGEKRSGRATSKAFRMVKRYRQSQSLLTAF